MRSYALALEDVNFNYGADFELSKINFYAPAREITGLLGPNGAGKTTSIHLLCGILVPTHGQLLFNREIVNNRDSFRSKVGFIPQYDGLFGELTLKENLVYFGSLHLLQREKLISAINFWAEKLQLEKHLNKRIKYFSGGMNRRSNIIAGLLHEPEVIILDEPTSGVDIQSRKIIHDIIHELKNKGKTIIYTSHLLNEAEDLCDSFYIMDNGTVVYTDRMETINANGTINLQELFISLTGQLARD